MELDWECKHSFRRSFVLSTRRGQASVERQMWRRLLQLHWCRCAFCGFRIKPKKKIKSNYWKNSLTTKYLVWRKGESMLAMVATRRRTTWRTVNNTLINLRINARALVFSKESKLTNCCKCWCCWCSIREIYIKQYLTFDI